MGNTLENKKLFQNAHIDKNSYIPIYAQLIKLIKYMINTKKIKEHQKLPTEEMLCHIYKISRTSVRQALQELVTNGYIYRLHGKGSFVKNSQIKQDLAHFYSFTEEMKRLGKIPSSKIFSFKKELCTQFIQNKFLSSHEKEMYVIIRLRLADSQPMYYEISYLPATRFLGLKRIYFQNTSMYEVFFHRYNIELVKAEESFSAEYMPKQALIALGISKRTPGIRQERIAYDIRGVVEYTCSFVPGDRFVYRVILKND